MKTMSELKTVGATGQIVRAIVLFTKDTDKGEEEPDYESLGIPKPKKTRDDYEPCEFRFKLSDVSSYNESGIANTTTLRLRAKDYFLLDHSFEDFDAFIQNGF